MKWYLLTYYSIIGAGIIIGLVRYKSLAKSSKIIVLLLAFSLLTEVVAEILSAITEYYLLIYAIFQPIEFTLITCAFYYELRNKYLLWTIPVYILFVIINGFWIQPVQNVFASYPIVVTFILTSIWALLYLRELLKYPTDFNLNDFALFWYSVGLLLFNVFTIFNYGPFNYIDKHLYELIGPLFRAIRIVANYVLYLLAIFTLLNKQKSFYSLKG